MNQSPPENQCIFVQGYHVVRILNFWPKIRAAGPDYDMHDPEPESGADMHLEVVGAPSEADVGNPLSLTTFVQCLEVSGPHSRSV